MILTILGVVAGVMFCVLTGFFVGFQFCKQTYFNDPLLRVGTRVEGPDGEIWELMDDETWESIIQKTTVH